MYFAAYLLLGLIFLTIAHFSRDCLNRRSGLPFALIMGELSFLLVALWPIILVAMLYRMVREEKLLERLLRH